MEHATLAERYKEAGHVHVRSHENFRWRVALANIGEQEQRQQCTATVWRLTLHCPRTS
jgi:hypothetical protein